MPTFVFTYRTTPGYTRTPESAEAWMAWFNGMGGHLADIGKPAAEAASVANCGPGTELGGYSLINAAGLGGRPRRQHRTQPPVQPLTQRRPPRPS
jgi:hypothetical protein